VPFDPKKALDAWKKAKPITLTKTGVSEVLRVLVANPTQAQLKAYETALATLATKMTDAKIKAVKKALDCIKTIHDNLKSYLAEVKSERQEAVSALKSIHTAAKAFYDTVSKGPSDAVYTYATKMGPSFKTWPQQSDAAVIPADLNTKVEAMIESMGDRVRELQNIHKGEVGGKALDIKNKAAAYTNSLKGFQSAYGNLTELWGKLEALKP
jgi:hypothetical protein